MPPARPDTKPSLAALSVLLGKVIMVAEQQPKQGPKDPRDPVGQNPTGRARKSSAGKRRQEERKADRDLSGTRWERKKRK